MKAVKEGSKVVQAKGFDVLWAYDHGRHALDKHDHDIRGVHCSVRMDRKNILNNLKFQVGWVGDK